MKRIGDHKWKATQSIPIEIGKPTIPPTKEALTTLRNAVASTGITKAYWFWLSLSGDQPHLGLAVAPNDDEIIS